MESYTGWFDTFSASLKAIFSQILGYIPKVLVAAVVLLAGWLIAKLLRVICIQLLQKLDHLWQRIVLRGHLDHLRLRHPPTKFVGEMVFWLVMLFFLAAAADVLELAAFVTGLAKVAAYLPVLLAGLLIVLAGFIVASLVRDLVTAAAESAGMAQAHLLGQVVQSVILFTAIVIGVNQIGIDATFLIIVVAITLAAALGGLALAFALGARAHVGNIIAAYRLRETCNVGDTVRINEVEGRVVDITLTSLILDSAQGRVVVPAAVLEKEICRVITQGDTHEND